MKNYFILLLITTVLNSYSQENQHLNLDKNNLAVDGYDLVSYFDGNPQEGKKTVATNYKGVTYFFINTENRERFKKNPNKYLPQYGGWCAYAMGDSAEKVSVDPETYKIIDGKLYLFYNKFFTNTLNSWNENETVLKLNAGSNWLEIIK